MQEDQIKTDSLSNKRVLVTGGSGFIGSHFIQELSRLGARVYFTYKSGSVSKNLPVQNASGIQVDLCKTDLSSRLTDQVDMIINCAAEDGDREYKQKYSQRIFNTNMRILSNVLSYASRQNINCVVSLSSIEVYPRDSEGVFNEDYDYYAKYNSHDDGYILSKRYGELLCLEYARHYNLKVMLPRLCNTYGPRDHFNSKIQRLIPTIIQRIADDKSITIYGDGTQQMQFIYIKDLVKVILNLAEKNAYSILNIGPDKSISLSDLVSAISKLMKKSPRILYNQKSRKYPKRKIDVSRMRRFTDVDLVSLDDGLKETIRWYNKNVVPST